MHRYEAESSITAPGSHVLDHSRRSCVGYGCAGGAQVPGLARLPGDAAFTTTYSPLDLLRRLQGSQDAHAGAAYVLSVLGRRPGARWRPCRAAAGGGPAWLHHR